MYILRRYHLPAVATCAIKSLISAHGFLMETTYRAEMQMQAHIEFKSDEDAERCTILAKI